MEPAVRLYMESLAEQLIAGAATQLLQQGQQHAEHEIQAHAVRVMLALTPAALGEAVVGTAAAIVAEYASTACAQRLLSQVRREDKKKNSGVAPAFGCWCSGLIVWLEGF